MKIQYEIMQAGVTLTTGRSAPIGGKFWVDWSQITDRERERLSSWLRNRHLRSTGLTEGTPEIGDGKFEEGAYRAPEKPKVAEKDEPERKRRYPVGEVEIIAAAIDGDADAMERMDEAGDLIAEAIMRDRDRERIARASWQRKQQAALSGTPNPAGL